MLERLKIFQSRRSRWISVSVLVLFVAFCVISAHLFVWPSTGMPARVDAIVVLGGPGDRVGYGMQLAREDRARYLVFSKDLWVLPPGICTRHVGPATVLCFQPDPNTTQGEAEGTARLAKQYGWQSLAVVTTRDQAWRARLWFGRCYSGQIYSVTAPVSWFHVPSAILYEWGATIKAEFFNRSC